jgi:hypothetical protein
MQLFVLPPRTLDEMAREVRARSVLLCWRSQRLCERSRRLRQRWQTRSQGETGHAPARLPEESREV